MQEFFQAVLHRVDTVRLQSLVNVRLHTRLLVTVHLLTIVRLQERCRFGVHLVVQVVLQTRRPRLLWARCPRILPPVTRPPPTNLHTRFGTLTQDCVTLLVQETFGTLRHVREGTFLQLTLGTRLHDVPKTLRQSRTGVRWQDVSHLVLHVGSGVTIVGGIRGGILVPVLGSHEFPFGL